MKKCLRGMICALAITALLACDREGRFIDEFGLDRLEPGVSTEADVRLVMGRPDAIVEERDGGRTMQYPRGPEGARTWFFVLDNHGTLRAYRQVLTLENFGRVQPGMEREQIRRMFGKPRSIVQFPLKNEEVWDWKYLHDHNPQLFNVHFDIDSGKVTRTSRSSLR